MDKYEIRSPSRDKKEIWFKIFHKNNARASIRSLKSGDLIDVLNNWDNNSNNNNNYYINHSINLKRCLKKNENIKESVHMNDEIVENMLSLLKEGMDVIKTQDYFNKIKEKVRDCKEKKDKEGISRRVIFKFMDMLDSF